jgi:endoglucanase
MFAGHCDQLGLLVSHVDDDGFLFVQTVGGWDPQQLVGQRVTVWSEGGPVAGVISRKAIHLLDEAERKQVAEIKNLWVDIGAKDKDDAEAVVAVGDPATVQLGVQEMRNGTINAPGMDNRTGVWVVVEGFRRAVEAGLSASLFCASTVQEEIGLRGARTSAFGIDPQVAIAVDVTHATDCPGVDKRQRGSVSLGGGPVLIRGANINPVVWQRLRDEAEAAGLPYQVAALGQAAPNDANVLQVTRAGVATGLVQIPNRYMHSPVEVVSWEDLEAAADLLGRFACSVSADDDFVPR